MRLLLTGCMAMIAVSSAQAEKFTLTPKNTKVEFVGTKTNGKHEGGFQKCMGSCTCAANDPTMLQIMVEIDCNSMYTDNRKLTAHLKSPDFFDVRSNPKAKFVTKKVEKTDKGLKIKGELTMCGKTALVEFPAKVSMDGNKMTLTSEFKIDRTKWGMTYGKGMIDDMVTLKISVQAEAK